MQQGRLKWTRAVDGQGFVARPGGDTDFSKHAAIWLDGTRPYGLQWQWAISWDHRFTQTGGAPSKQAAADQANTAWEEQCRTAPPANPPQDLDGEITSLLDQALTRPIDFDLTARPTDYLHRLIWHVRRRWQAELASETLPAPISAVVKEASEILFRRRAG
jgi:hypothetical protein